jgi:hypothetical protein
MSPPGPADKPGAPRRAPSSTDLKPVLDQTPEPDVANQRRFDSPKRTTLTELPAVSPPDRKPTLTGMPAPALPTEYQATLRANPLQHRTLNRPPPPSTVALAVRSDPPRATDTPIPGDASKGHPGPSTSLPPPSQDPSEATILAARRRAEAAEARVAELERQARVRAETDQASFPPPVTPSPAPKPTVEAEPAVLSWLIASATRNAKAIKALVAAFGIAGGAGAITVATNDKPAVETALRAELDAEKRKTTLMRQQLDGSLNREAAWQDYTTCLAEQQAEHFAQLLPAADRMGSADKPKPFLDKCKSRKP